MKLANKLQNPIIEAEHSATTGTAGQLRFNDTTSKMQVFNGSEWKSITDGNNYKAVKVGTQSVAATQSEDTLILSGGNGIAIDTNISTKTITISGTALNSESVAHVDSSYSTDTTNKLYPTIEEAVNHNEVNIIFTGNQSLPATVANASIYGQPGASITVTTSTDLKSCTIKCDYFRGAMNTEIYIYGNTLIKANCINGCEFYMSSTASLFKIDTVTYQNNLLSMTAGSAELRAVDNNYYSGSDSNHWLIHGGRLLIEGFTFLQTQSDAVPAINGIPEQSVIHVAAPSAPVYIILKDCRFWQCYFRNTITGLYQGYFLLSDVETSNYLFLTLQNTNICGNNANLIYNRIDNTQQRILNIGGSCLAYTPNGSTANAWLRSGDNYLIDTGNGGFWN